MTQAPARSPQKFVSTAAWEAAKADYLAGDTAVTVARRYGIGIDNLRKRQINEGWTRKAQRAARGNGPWPEERGRLGPAETRAPDRAERVVVSLEKGLPPHPARALALAVQRAAALVAEGRGREAQAVIKAAESLSKLTGMKPEAAHPDADSLHAREAGLIAWSENLEQSVRALAMQTLGLALGLEPDAPPLEPWRRGYVYYLRARMTPDRARGDAAQHAHEPWAEDVWDETGAARPLEEIDARTMKRYRDAWREAMGLPTDAASWARADRTARIPDPQQPAWPA